MTVYDNEFTCINGHKWTANAKRLSKCPECGVNARKQFTKPEPAAQPPVDTGVASDPITKPLVTLLRKGKRSMPVAKSAPAKPVRKGGPPKGVIPPQFLKSRTAAAKPGVVRTHTAMVRKQTPMITKKPKRTAVARVTSANHGGKQKPFWHSVAEWMGF